jgi:hypothetical protein
MKISDSPALKLEMYMASTPDSVGYLVLRGTDAR